MPVVREVASINSDGNSENVYVKELYNYHESSAPGVTDDEDAGYAVGDLWLNGATDTLYHCADATAGAAVWTTATIAGAVVPANYTPAQSLLVAVANQTPLAQVVAAGQFVGRPLAGNLGVMTATQARAVIAASTAAVFDEIASAAGVIRFNKMQAKSSSALVAGPQVLTASQMVGGVITHAAAGAPDTLTVATAVNIIAAAGVGSATGTSFEFTVVNTGLGSSDLTTAAGVTLTGAVRVATGTSGTWLCVVTSPTTVTCFRK